jgi:hypothetical protein
MGHDHKGWAQHESHEEHEDMRTSSRPVSHTLHGLRRAFDC